MLPSFTRHVITVAMVQVSHTMPTTGCIVNTIFHCQNNSFLKINVCTPGLHYLIFTHGAIAQSQLKKYLRELISHITHCAKIKKYLCFTVHVHFYAAYMYIL